MTGLVNVFKPAAWTSRDVVTYVQNAVGAVKAGHTGTLDPGAVGVLLVLTGRATRLQDCFVRLRKIYVAEVTLGIATDTGDSFGRVTHTAPCAPREPEAIAEALPQFVGEIEQVPPMSSAVKVKGRRLYEYARRGQRVQRPVRQVQIYDLGLLRYRAGPPPRALLQVECSAGTYIRTLVEDVARAAGTCGHMSFLVRSQVGSFAAGEAVSVDEIDDSVVISANRALDFLPGVQVNDADASLVRNGVAPRETGPGDALTGDRVRIVDSRGRLLALGEVHDDSSGPTIFPRRVFPEPL